MTIVIFIIVLVLLILVHELGHFLVAKYFGIRVDEFGIGFPPKVASLFWWKGTEFTFNAIPFGGFVKIFGENPDEESLEGEDKERSMVNKNRAIQSAVLLAGVTFNALFAGVLIIFAFMIGVPAASDMYDEEHISDPRATVVSVLPDSPAERAGFEARDILLQVRDNGEVQDITRSADLSEFVTDRGGSEVTITFERDGTEREMSVVPEEAVTDEEGAAVGLGIQSVGVVSFSPLSAVWEGSKHTVILTGVITVELVRFIGQAVTGTADFSEVAGPVGIVSLVGDAWTVGFAYLMYFTAIISLHLAIINLFPFPALDGGRLLFVGIEAITRKQISPVIANGLNVIGFVLLILLMVIITINDVSNLLG